MTDPDRIYRERYEWALRQTQVVSAMPWDDLPEASKQKIRDEVHRYDREMRDFGELISRGASSDEISAFARQKLAEKQ
jgi:hypothetical protein